MRPGSNLAKEVRRTARNLFFVNLTIAVSTVLLPPWHGQYFYNIFHGPFQANIQFLVADKQFTSTETSPKDALFLTVTGSNVIDTGIREFTTTTGRYTGDKSTEASANYYLLQLSNHLLLIEAQSGIPRKLEYSGELGWIKDDLRQALYSNPVLGHLRLKSTLLPRLLKESNYRENGYIVLFILGILLLIATWNMLKAISRFIIPSSHPAFAEFA